MRKKTNQKKRFVSIRKKLLVSLALTAVAMTICTTAASYKMANARVMDISKRLSEQSTTSVGESVQERINDLQAATTSLVQNDSLYMLASISDLENAGVGSYERSFIPAAKDLINPIKSSDAFDFIGIFLKNGYRFESDYMATLPFSDFDTCMDYCAASGILQDDDVYAGAAWRICGKNRENEDMVLYFRFTYEKLTLRRTGVIVCGLSRSNLKRMLSGGAFDLYLVAGDGSILASSKVSASGTYPGIDQIVSAMRQTSYTSNSLSYTDEQKQTHVVSFYKIWEMDAYLIAPFEYYRDIQAREMAEYIRSAGIVVCAELAAIFLISLWLSRDLSKSVQGLVAFTKEIKEGSGDKRYTARSNDEIAYLGEEVNQMLDKIHETEQLREEELLANQVMQVQLLQQQINPHLLYNTLDSLLWALQQERYADATSLVTSLSEFFKISLSRGREMVSLNEEIELIRYYLELQKLARNKVFGLHIDIPAELMTFPISKLTLQPLVENSVLHGFSGYRDDGGVICIQARLEQDTLKITVEDNGIGMMDEEVAVVNAALQIFPRPESFNHFGLYNIHRRIVQQYGEQYGLRVESDISVYTRVIIYLPYEGQA